MKQIMKTTDEGITQIPDKGKVDFGEMIIREDLFKKGIDPKTITSESQLDGILNTPHVSPKPKKSGEVIDVDFGNWPEKKAGGGITGTGLNYLLGEDDQNSRVTYAAGSTQKDFNQYLKDGEKRDREEQRKKFEKDFEDWKKWQDTQGGTMDFAAEGGRIGLKKGHSPGRRKFLKVAAGLATIPVLGKFFKWAKPLAKTAKVADLTSVPIKDISGMPAWFKPLVNKVIKEGDDVTKKYATVDREIVHAAELPGSKTKIIVEQDLTTGDVIVDIGQGKHGFSSGHLGQPVRLEYKAGEWIEPTVKKGETPSKGTKTQRRVLG